MENNEKKIVYIIFARIENEKKHIVYKVFTKYDKAIEFYNNFKKANPLYTIEFTKRNRNIRDFFRILLTNNYIKKIISVIRIHFTATMFLNVIYFSSMR